MNPREKSTLPPWQEALIAALFNAIKNNYIFPNNKNIAPQIFKKVMRDNFLAINKKYPNADKEKFCHEVNEVLKKIDPHLILQYDPKQLADHLDNKRIIKDPRKNNGARFVLEGLDPPKEFFEKFARENFGFSEAPEEKHFPLPKTVGFIKINDFLDPRDTLGRLAEAKAIAILKNLQGKQAIIIDLRDSHGGSPEMVELLMSYFLSEKDKAKIKNGVYNTIIDYSTGTKKDYRVRPTAFTLNVPLYVLTNKNTFSAAEEFAYDLQQLNHHVLRDNRCLIVGQTTKGGAHPMTGFPLLDPVADKINSDYFIWVPTRNAVNPYSLTNWEDGPKKAGKKPGVVPHVVLNENQNALTFAIAHGTENHLSSVAKAASMMGLPRASLNNAPLEKVEPPKDNNDDISDEEMAKSAFGQQSNTAKRLRRF